MSPAIVPPMRPDLTRDEALALLAEADVTLAPGHAPVLLGRRGYFRGTMHTAGQGRGLYDDMLALVTPTRVLAFNANTDPSVAKPGVAVLAPGVWKYRLGIHGLTKPAARQYEALVQAAEVTVVRDGGNGRPGWRDTGWFGINIHRGSQTTTSSLGCQTIHPDQWDGFIDPAQEELHKAGQARVRYVLTDRGSAAQ